MITTLQELRDYFGADSVSGLNRRLYKDTDCGASISLLLGTDPRHAGSWLHDGDNPQLWQNLDGEGSDSYAYGFSIQTIVEGSDIAVESEPFLFPVAEERIADWIDYMESKASRLWHEANDMEGEEEK